MVVGGIANLFDRQSIIEMMIDERPTVFAREFHAIWFFDCLITYKFCDFDVVWDFSCFGSSLDLELKNNFPVVDYLVWKIYIENCNLKWLMFFSSSNILV